MIIKTENLDDLKLKGIYKITNTTNNKSYIGSTWKSFNSRYKQHLTKLRQGKHHCVHMQRAWDLYGTDTFIFEIVEIITDKDILLNREELYIKKYDCCSNGYNENPIPNLSPMYNETSRRKSSITHKQLWEDLESSMTEDEFFEYKKQYLEKRGFVEGRKIWNKGITMTKEQTENMRKPKKNGVSEKMKAVHMNNAKLIKDKSDYVIVYDSEENWINTFWCISDLVEYSKSKYNTLPVIIRKGGVTSLSNSKVSEHIKDGKLYKGLLLKRAPKSWKLSYANGMNSWNAQTPPIMSQAESTLSEGAETTGEVKTS